MNHEQKNDRNRRDAECAEFFKVFLRVLGDSAVKPLKVVTCVNYEKVCWDDPKENAVHTQTDSYSSHELNPLAAGFQTPFQKGDTAYVLMV
jgi:hypothetical protein